MEFVEADGEVLLVAYEPDEFHDIFVVDGLDVHDEEVKESIFGDMAFVIGDEFKGLADVLWV